MDDNSLIDKTGIYESWGIEGGYAGYTLSIDGEDVPAMVREKLGIKYEDVGEDALAFGMVASSWRLRIRVDLVDNS